VWDFNFVARVALPARLGEIDDGVKSGLTREPLSGSAGRLMARTGVGVTPR